MKPRPVLPPAAQAVMLAAVLLFAVVIACEVWRRRRDPGAVTPGQFRRRLWGALLMEIDLGLWLGADLLIRAWPPAWQLVYLTFALALLLAPMVLAVREWAFVVRQYARSRADLVHNFARQTKRHDPADHGRS